ncbi:MAG: hypothetical protein GY928_08480 [Colwellia sp.]|nr:hypothetical protein [Colwellia sp.]
MSKMRVTVLTIEQPCDYEGGDIEATYFKVGIKKTKKVVKAIKLHCSRFEFVENTDFDGVEFEDSYEFGGVITINEAAFQKVSHNSRQSIRRDGWSQHDTYNPISKRSLRNILEEFFFELTGGSLGQVEVFIRKGLGKFQYFASDY